MRLRCMRCGDLDEMEPDGEPVGIGIICIGWCSACRLKLYMLRTTGVPWHRRYALMRRAQRDQERHPTYRALVAARDALEAVPHGTQMETDHESP